MPAVFTLLIGFLVDAAGTIAGRVMLSLGISLITYTGVSASLEWAAAQIAAGWSGLPAQALGVLGVLRVGQDIAIIVGALTAKLALNGLSGGSITKWVTKK